MAGSDITDLCRNVWAYLQQLDARKNDDSVPGLLFSVDLVYAGPSAVSVVCCQGSESKFQSMDRASPGLYEIGGRILSYFSLINATFMAIGQY